MCIGETDMATEIKGESGPGASYSVLRMGPLGAVVVSELLLSDAVRFIGRVSFMEARVSIAGIVIPWGVSVPEVA